MLNNFNTFGQYNSMPSATQPYGIPMNNPYGMSSMTPNNYNIPQQATQPSISTGSNKILVDGIEDVKNYYVAPGGDFTFLHKTEPILFNKIVDNKGNITIETYDITKHIDECNYISKEEFKSLKSELNEIKSLLNKSKEGCNESISK